MSQALQSSNVKNQAARVNPDWSDIVLYFFSFFFMPMTLNAQLDSFGVLLAVLLTFHWALLAILLTFHSELSLRMIYTFNFHKLKKEENKSDLP